MTRTWYDGAGWPTTRVNQMAATDAARRLSNDNT